MDAYSYEDALADSKMIVEDFYDFSSQMQIVISTSPPIHTATNTDSQIKTAANDDTGMELDEHLKSVRDLDFCINLLSLVNGADDEVSSSGGNMSKNLSEIFNLLESQQEFQPHMIALSDEDLSSFGICREISSNHNIDVKQLQKDMERDILLINGMLKIGSICHVDGILHTCVDVISSLVAEKTRAMNDTSLYEAFSKHCLTRSSRTHSGSAAFHMMKKLVDSEDYLIIPMSQHAPPLMLRYTVEPCIAEDRIGVQLCCDIECATVFRIQSINASDKVYHVKIVYLDRIISSLSVNHHMSTKGACIRIERFLLKTP